MTYLIKCGLVHKYFANNSLDSHFTAELLNVAGAIAQDDICKYTFSPFESFRLLALKK